MLLYVWPPLALTIDEIERVARSLAPTTEGLGIEEVGLHCLRPDPATGELRERLIRSTTRPGRGSSSSRTTCRPSRCSRSTSTPRRSCSPGAVERRTGRELLKQLVAPHAGGRTDVTGGSFQEFDLDADHGLVLATGLRVATPRASSWASSPPPPSDTRRAWYVALLGDPTKALGSLAEPGVGGSSPPSTWPSRWMPLEWFALSAGARIAMDSGTENMDWIAAVPRRLIEFTQAGHEVNVVVTGINVGAQPYWNAEATMLMHTKGILVMTPDSAMVLTGKQALDYSGSVSAEDNLGIGGYERIMGPNGQGQYWAPDLPAAISVLAGALRPRLRRSRRTVPARGDERPVRPRCEGVPPPPRRQPDHDRR